MTTWGPEIDAVLNSGVDLEAFAVKGWALRRADALSALVRLRDLGVPILGGDAFEREAGELTLGYANWSCEMVPGEEVVAFVDRSAQVARSFISEYGGRDPYFSIVPGIARTLRSV